MVQARSQNLVGLLERLNGLLQEFGDSLFALATLFGMTAIAFSVFMTAREEEGITKKTSKVRRMSIGTRIPAFIRDSYLRPSNSSADMLSSASLRENFRLRPRLTAEVLLCII